MAVYRWIQQYAPPSQTVPCPSAGNSMGQESAQPPQQPIIMSAPVPNGVSPPFPVPFQVPQTFGPHFQGNVPQSMMPVGTMMTVPGLGPMSFMPCGLPVAGANIDHSGTQMGTMPTQTPMPVPDSNSTSPQETGESAPDHFVMGSETDSSHSSAGPCWPSASKRANLNLETHMDPNLEAAIYAQAIAGELSDAQQPPCQMVTSA